MDGKAGYSDKQYPQDHPPLMGRFISKTDKHNKEKHSDRQTTETNQKQSIWQKWRAIGFTNQLILVFTFVIAAATSVYAVLAYHQLKVMAGQLKEMRAASRPWVGLDIEQPALRTSPLVIDKDKTVHSVGSVVVRNFGNYPAQNVFAGVELMVTQNTTSVHEREKQLCAEHVSTNIGTVVFPGPNKIAWQWPLQVTKEQMIRSPGSSTEFLAFIIGCIFYRDQFGEPHHTGFTYRLQKSGTIWGVAFEPSPNTTIQGEWVQWGGFVD